MDFKEIIDDIQSSIIQLQNKLDKLKVLDSKTAKDVMLTRQEAADLMNVSLRQVDRLCNSFTLHKITTINGVRISKREVLVQMGVLQENHTPQSDFNTIIRRGLQ